MTVLNHPPPRMHSRNNCASFWASTSSAVIIRNCNPVCFFGNGSSSSSIILSCGVLEFCKSLVHFCAWHGRGTCFLAACWNFVSCIIRACRWLGTLSIGTAMDTAASTLSIGTAMETTASLLVLSSFPWACACPEGPLANCASAVLHDSHGRSTG